MADRINILAGDFSTIRNELLAKLKGLPGWNDTTESSVGQTLVRLYAYIGDLLMFRMNTLANENYLDTAQIKDNMLKLVKMLNYRMQRANPSHGEIEVYMKLSSSKPVIIPQGTRFATSSGIMFYAIKETEIPINEKTVTIQVIQGIQREQNVKSDGSKNQKITLNANSKDYYLGENTVLSETESFRAIEVYVDGTLWEPIDSLVNADPTDEVYYIEPISDYAAQIYFGDNTFGKIPPSTSTIRIVYNLNIGKFGNIDANAITTIQDTIADIDGVAVNAYVKQTSSFMNGDDPEDIESVRDNAPKYFRTGDRGITADDIEALIRANFSNILAVYIHGEEDQNPPNFRLFNQITIGLLLANSAGLPLEPTPGTNENYLSFYKDVDDLIAQKRSLTVWRKYIVPEATPVYFKVTYHRYEGYSDTEVETAIKTAINDYMIEKSALATTIKHSDLVRAVEDVDGVDYCFISLKRAEETEYSVQNITFDTMEFPSFDLGYVTLIKE